MIYTDVEDRKVEIDGATFTVRSLPDWLLTHLQHANLSSGDGKSAPTFSQGAFGDYLWDLCQFGVAGFTGIFNREGKELVPEYEIYTVGTRSWNRLKASCMKWNAEVAAKLGVEVLGVSELENDTAKKSGASSSQKPSGQRGAGARKGSPVKDAAE
jgi:hypothetical protein